MEMNFIHFLREFSPEEIDIFFSQKIHIETYLFPFFDFLKNTYFSQNKSIPKEIDNILSHNQSLQKGLMRYIEQRNAQIVSGQFIEQYDIIAFHLFLL